MDLGLSPTRVLFVDDEPAVLDGIRNALRRDRRRWEMSFALGAEAGLRELEGADFDIVVSDMRMPGMDGPQFLSRVREVQPLALRFVLSGHAERASIQEARSVAHHFLSKPCEPVVLRSMLERASDLSRRISNGALRRLVSSISTLPVGLRAAWPDGASSVHGVDEGAAAARFVEMTNAVFSMKASSDASRVLTQLGAEVANAVAIAAQSFGKFLSLGVPEGEVSRVQHHSLMTAWLAPTMLDDVDDARTAFTAGLLHDVGRLALCLSPEHASDVSEDDAEEEENPHVGHAAVGAHLLGRWGLPLAVIEAVAHHHHPPPVAGSFSVPWAVHLADALVHEAAGQKLNVLSAISTQRTTAAFLADLENRMSAARKQLLGHAGSPSLRE